MAKTTAKGKPILGATKSAAKTGIAKQKDRGGQTGKPARPAAAKHVNASKTSKHGASSRGGSAKTQTAAKMANKTTTITTDKAKTAANAAKSVLAKLAPAKSAPAKSAPGKLAPAKSVPGKLAPAKSVPAKAAAPKAVVKPAGKPVAASAGAKTVKPVAPPQAAAKVAAKVVAKPAPEKTAAKPATDKAAAVAPARPPGGTHVSAKSAAERLVAVRAAVAAKAQAVKAPVHTAAAPPPQVAAPAAAAAVLAKPYVPGAPRPGSSFSSGRPGFPPGGGPNVKPMPKPSGGRHFGFKALEYIVYPAHGVGQIVAIEEQQVAGYTLELFVVNFAKDKLTLKVPAPKVAHGAIRKLADAALVQRALDCLTGRARIKRTMWSRRAQEYEAKINSGDLIAIAEVVRDLYRSDAQPEQSYSERQLFEAALDRMAREIAAVQKLTDTEALKVLDGQLQKGPRRGVKADAAAEADVEAEAADSPGEIEEAA